MQQRYKSNKNELWPPGFCRKMVEKNLRWKLFKRVLIEPRFHWDVYRQIDFETFCMMETYGRTEQRRWVLMTCVWESRASFNLIYFSNGALQYCILHYKIVALIPDELWLLLPVSMDFKIFCKISITNYQESLLLGTLWFGLVVAPRTSLERLPSKVTALPCAS